MKNRNKFELKGQIDPTRGSQTGTPCAQSWTTKQPKPPSPLRRRAFSARLSHAFPVTQPRFRGSPFASAETFRSKTVARSQHPSQAGLASGTPTAIHSTRIRAAEPKHVPPQLHASCTNYPASSPRPEDRRTLSTPVTSGSRERHPNGHSRQHGFEPLNPKTSHLNCTRAAPTTPLVTKARRPSHALNTRHKRVSRAAPQRPFTSTRIRAAEPKDVPPQLHASCTNYPARHQGPKTVARSQHPSQAGLASGTPTAIHVNTDSSR